MKTLIEGGWVVAYNRTSHEVHYKYSFPALRRHFESRCTACWERFFGELIEVGTKRRVWLPLVGATLIPTVSYSELLSYSTAAVIGAGGLVSDLAPKIKELVLESSRLRRSSLFFLLNLR
jgi:hypothetical protein